MSMRDDDVDLFQIFKREPFLDANVLCTLCNRGSTCIGQKTDHTFYHITTISVHKKTHARTVIKTNTFCGACIGILHGAFAEFHEHMGYSAHETAKQLKDAKTKIQWY